MHYCAMMRVVPSWMRVVLLCAILSFYRSIAQPSNCCSYRCRNDTSNNLSNAAKENEPWNRWNTWNEWLDCTNRTTGNTPAPNSSFVCDKGNRWINATEQYYTCCVLEKRRLSVAQLTTTLVLGCFTLGFVMVLMLGIFRSKQVRRLPFNAYLVFLFVPSLIFIASRIVTAPLFFNCIESAFHIDILVFGFYCASNVFLNAIVAHDICILLRKSKKCLRTKPLPLSTIYKRVTIVYVIAALFGMWITILCSDVINAWPPFSSARRVAFKVTIALVSLPPVFYVLYICIRVWKDKLLPLSGETRALAFYFLRIAIVFFVIWGPLSILASMYLEKWGYDFFIVYDLNYWMLVGEIISVALALTKPDVLLAVKRLVYNGRGCQQWKARRRRPVPGASSEQVSEGPADTGRESESAMRMSAWDKPDDYGDIIARELSWMSTASRRVEGDSVNVEENE